MVITGDGVKSGKLGKASKDSLSATAVSLGGLVLGDGLTADTGHFRRVLVDCSSSRVLCQHELLYQGELNSVLGAPCSARTDWVTPQILQEEDDM